jgi:class 3 adenylate cyclase
MLAVLDAVGSTRAVVAGQLEGGAVAAFFAATYPERTSAFVWFGTLPRSAEADDFPSGMSLEEHRAWIERDTRTWGTAAYVREWFELEHVPEATDAAFVDWVAKVLRHTASPTEAVALERVWFETDVRDVLPTIRVPALILSTGTEEDREVDAYTASLIREANLVTLDRSSVITRGSEPELVDAIRSFLGVERPPIERDRVLTTVLVTDIVGSTRALSELGDHAWKELLQRHHDRVRGELARHRGVEIDTAGDGFLATFDGPARAVRCALAVAESIASLGVEIRAGVHTGEVEVVGDGIRGLAVHIGARISSLAGPSEVLASSTVRDLVAGSGLDFADVGEHVLKGVPDTWRLYRVIG